MYVFGFDFGFASHPIGRGRSCGDMMAVQSILLNLIANADTDA
jgi:hypothetical protein